MGVSKKTKMARRVPAAAAVVVLSTASASRDVAANHGRGHRSGAEALRYDNPKVFALAIEKVLDTTHRRGERRGATPCDKCCDKECKMHNNNMDKCLEYGRDDTA